jgi:hypothetical protein
VEVNIKESKEKKPGAKKKAPGHGQDPGGAGGNPKGGEGHPNAQGPMQHLGGAPPHPADQGHKPGQGIPNQSAMHNGMGDFSHMGPPPMAPQMMQPLPPPEAPIGPGGLPIGGNLPSSDPMMDPSMSGSSLFRRLNMQLDPYSSPVTGHGMLGQAGGMPGMPGMPAQTGMPGPGEEGAELMQLLALLGIGQSAMAMNSPGMNMNHLNPSGVFNEPTHPGETRGLNNFNVIQ